MERPFVRGPTTPFRGLTITMVANYLQVMGWSSKNSSRHHCGEFKEFTTRLAMVHCPVFEGAKCPPLPAGFCVFLVLWKCFEAFNGCGWEARTFTNDLGVSKNRGVSPQIIPFVHRVFHYFHHPFWGFSHYFWVDTHLKPYIFWQMATRVFHPQRPTYGLGSCTCPTPQIGPNPNGPRTK